MLEYIKSDLFRYTSSISFYKLCLTFLSNPFFRFQVYLRLSHCKFNFVKFLILFLKSRLSRKTGIQISQYVSIGYGLYIPHGNVVVNGTATIGNNCSLLQFSSIGSVVGNAAIIKDNVYIGPNVCVVEDVVVGDNVIIGAGSVVINDIQSDKVVGGIPAKVINSHKKIEDVAYNLWQI